MNVTDDLWMLQTTYEYKIRLMNTKKILMHGD